MFEASNEIASKLGRPPVRLSRADLRLAQNSTFLGLPMGEWMILLADKAPRSG